jgi:deoxyribonuclease V
MGALFRVRSRVPRGFHLEVARSIQRMLAGRVVERDLVSVDDVDIIAGIDVAYIEKGSEKMPTWRAERSTKIDHYCD